MPSTSVSSTIDEAFLILQKGGEENKTRLKTH